MDIETAIGLAAAFFTTTANLPQAIKVWRTRSADDLSLKMLFALATGLALWVAYGLMKSDVAIILANALSLGLVGFLISFKLGGLFRLMRNRPRRT